MDEILKDKYFDELKRETGACCLCGGTGAGADVNNVFGLPQPAAPRWVFS